MEESAMQWDGSRRAVLRGIGAGVVAGALTPAAACAQSGRKLGYAIVGLGYYATRMIMPRIAECEHARLVALVSGTPAKLVEYGDQYGIPKTHRYSYAEYDRIKDNPDIDMVYIVLPNGMHAEYSIRASQAGKHVLCEKPMANTAAEAEAMIAAAKKAGKKLMIGYRSRFQPHNVHAIELVKSGRFGRTRLVTAEAGFNIGDPRQWRLDKALSGGGSLMDIGIYALQAIRYLSGEEPRFVQAVESTDRSDVRFKTVEDRIDWQMLLPSGGIAHGVSSYSSNHNQMRVTGEKGWVELYPGTNYQGQKLFVRENNLTEERTPPSLPKDQFVGQLDHLAECALTGREPLVPGEEGLRDMRLIAAIYRSAREGQRIELKA
jgi:predicted dehydrogenase